jgi:hypothetical protein
MGIEINSFVLSFIFLLVGVILLGVIADEVTAITQQNTINNETVTLTNSSTTSLANSQLDSFTSLVNSSNTSQTYVEDTDYTVDLSGGSVTSLSPSGAALATYVYRDVGNSAARSLTVLITLFFTFGVFLASVGFAVKGLKDANIM